LPVVEVEVELLLQHTLAVVVEQEDTELLVMVLLH
jgi:hypothetical protein